MFQLLSWTFAPFSTNQIQGSTCQRASAPVYVTPSGFGYPPDVLLPLNPSETVRLTALLGFALRSFARWTRYGGVSAVVGPPAVPAVSDATTFVAARCHSSRLLGFNPRPEPRHQHGFPRRYRRSSLGLSPSRVLAGVRPCSGSHRNSSPVLHSQRLSWKPALQSLNRSGPGDDLFCRVTSAVITTLLGFLRLSGPQH